MAIGGSITAHTQASTRYIPYTNISQKKTGRLMRVSISYSGASSDVKNADSRAEG